MSAAALFTPGSGSFHTPHSERLKALPSGKRVAATETWHAIIDLLGRGKTQTHERVTDRFLAQHMGRSRRFVQKGLKALQDLGMIQRQRTEGRRIIIVLERLRGRARPQPCATTGAKSSRARPPSIPNIGIIQPATPEQVAAAAAAQAGEPPPPLTPEELAAAELVLQQFRQRRQAAERASTRTRPTADQRPRDPNAPGMAAQAILDDRRKAAGIRLAHDPVDNQGLPGRPAGP